MYNKLVFSFLFLFSLSIFGTLAASETYDINFQIKGLKGGKCLLGNYFGDKQYIQDSCIVDESGKGFFKKNKSLPGGIYLFVLPNKKYFEILLDKDQQFSFETDTLDFIENTKFKGSEDNTLFYKYLSFITKQQKAIEPLRTKYQDRNTSPDSAAAIYKRITVIDERVKNYKLNYIKENGSSMLSQIFKASEEPEIPETPVLANGQLDSSFAYRYYKKHFFDNVDFSDDRLLRTPIFHAKLNQYLEKLVMQLPDSLKKEADYLVNKAKANREVFKYVVYYITSTYEVSKIMGMDAVFVHMVDKYYTYDQATWMDSTALYKIQDRARILKPLLIGQQCMPLNLEDSLGKFHSLYALNARYTVLFFWDPDCSHCQKSMPKMIEVYEKYKPLGMEVFAVCTEVEVDKWKKYIREKKLTWINVGDPHLHNNFRHDFDISTTPQIFILDSSKKIIAKKLDVTQIDDFMVNRMRYEEAQKKK
jgi:peroxiredoxin